MLSIAAMTSGQEGYYQSLSKEDYYLEGGEPPGIWWGDGAKALGLEGRVSGRELSSGFRGFSRAGMPLVQNAGKASRQPGWDLTFSAPKSVSVLWSQLQGSPRKEIQAAHLEAVKAALAYLEQTCAYSRVGKGGADQVGVGLTVACFEHSTSRAMDPQLHTHCLVLNLGVDAAGACRSILSKPFFQAKMLAGAFYRCELSRQLQERLGVAIERPLDKEGRQKSWFELAGVQKSILSYFSQRRADVERELGTRGMESASAAAFAALSTRSPKSLVPPRRVLHAEWQLQGEQQGFSAKEVLGNPSRISAAEQRSRYRQALTAAIEELTCGDNHFSTADVVRRTLEAAQGESLAADMIVANVQRDLSADRRFVSLGAHQGEIRWTTQEVLQGEEDFIGSITALRARKFLPASEQIVSAAIARRRGVGATAFQLDAEQQAAVRYITQGKEAVKVISGFAGTGKTDMLAVARGVLERSGYQVIGTALAGVAARTLQEKSGIKSETIRKRERQLYPSLTAALKHHARQLGRAALGKNTQALPQLTIDAKTVLVIDEAGMVGTKDFANLARAVVAGGGSLVAVGDERQLSSIDRGGCFAKLVVELDGVRLTNIRRQEEAADREAVKSVVEGSPREALAYYARKGQFAVAQTRSAAEEELVADWMRNGGATSPQEHRVFVATKAEVRRINQLCQWERAVVGALNPCDRVEHNDEVYMAGDRVRFNSDRRTAGISKGVSGVVVACKAGVMGKYVAVKVDGVESVSVSSMLKHHASQLLKAACGKRTQPLPLRKDIVIVPLASRHPFAKCYEGLSLDYAMTTHLGQGQTVENAYVLLGGKMTDRELSYVQMSRHKKQLFLYADQAATGMELTSLAHAVRPVAERNACRVAPPDYASLVRDMQLSRTKELATSVHEREKFQLNVTSLQ